MFSGIRKATVLLADLRRRGDLQRAVEGEVALARTSSGSGRAAQREAGVEDLLAVPLAGHLDLLGEADLLLAGEQRDLAHLREVHADRVVDLLRPRPVEEEGRIVVIVPFLVFLDLRRLGVLVLGVHRRKGAAAARLALLLLLLVDDVDSQFLEGREDRVDPIPGDHVLGEETVDVLVGEEPLPLAFLDQRFQLGLQLHPVGPPPVDGTNVRRQAKHTILPRFSL